MKKEVNQSWKEKAKERRKELEKLKKRLKELEESRDGWKIKQQECKAKIRRLEKELAKFKKGQKQEKAKHHSYELWYVCLALQLLHQGGVSLRACQRILQILAIRWQLGVKVPSGPTINIWSKKLGYHAQSREEKLEGKWVLILDESVAIGQERLFLIQGVRLDNRPMDRALSIRDVEILALGIRSSWKGHEVKELLDRASAQVEEVLYGLGDQGNNIKKGLALAQLAHMPDCTHALGTVTKRLYAKDERFISFSKVCSKFSKQINLSADADLMPPKQRSKARFLNLFDLSSWAHEKLRLQQKWKAKPDTESQRRAERLAYLNDYRELIEELQHISLATSQIFKIIKVKGLNSANVEKCHKILGKSLSPEPWKQGVKDYLDTSVNLIPGLADYICCSDVIESTFGKYKQQVKASPYAGITDNCLHIGTYGHSLEQQKVKEALEKTRIVDLKQWKEENLGDTLLQKKRQMRKNVG
jgi:hypothetical protein